MPNSLLLQGGNKHIPVSKYADLTPFHIGTRDGSFSFEGMVAYKKPIS
jgi:hypothetical protein